jgi:hypothetical protein
MRAKLVLTLALAAIVPGCGSGTEPEVAGISSPLTATKDVAQTEPGAAALPPQVARTRAAILQALHGRDFEELRGLIADEGFTYTYGAPVEGGPIAYWQELQKTSPDAPLHKLEAVLQLPYTKVGDRYVWPFAYDRDPASFTDDELEMLSRVASPEEMHQWKEFGSYFGWRAGIRSDGSWIFFVAGD